MNTKQCSLTPETDALCASLFHDDGPSLSAPDGWVCPERDAAKIAAHARKMEAERDRLLAENKALREALEWALPLVDRHASYDLRDMEKHRAALAKANHDSNCPSPKGDIDNDQTHKSPGWVAAIDALYEKATKGPYFVSIDEAHDTIAHPDSGLAMIDTGRQGDWPVLRLGEWPTTEFIAALVNAWPKIRQSLLRPGKVNHD